MKNSFFGSKSPNLSPGDEVKAKKLDVFTIDALDKPRICFVGWLLARSVNGLDWFEIYKTSSGKFVCVSGRDERATRASVCADDFYVRMFFGYSDQAKQLYDDAGIDHARVVL